MNFRRILSLAAAFAAVAAATAVVVVASSYGVYAIAKVWLGPAGAAAVVAGVYAILAVIVALLATRKAQPRRVAGAPPSDDALVDRLVSLARERPIIALGAAATATAAAVTVLVRNPALVTALVSAFMAGNSSAKSGK